MPTYDAEFPCQLVPPAAANPHPEVDTQSYMCEELYCTLPDTRTCDIGLKRVESSIFFLTHT